MFINIIIDVRLMKRQQKQPVVQPKRIPVINLSSDQDSDSDKEKEYPCYESTLTTYTKPIYKSIPLCQNVNTSNVTCHKSINHMQFSTLNLDQNSIVDMDHHIKLLTSKGEELTRENQSLRAEILKLRNQVASFQGGKADKELEQQYKQRLEESYKQLQQLRLKYRKLQEDFRKTEKQFQNRLINQELPTKKSINDQNNRIYKEITDKLKQICNRFIEELSKEKMNANVEGIISNYIGQLMQINPRTNTKNVFGQYNSVNNPTPNRQIKLMQSVRPQSEDTLNISSDYRLLQKSIEKLKQMEKAIDSSSGSYLKRPQQKDESLVYRSGALDQSSLSGLDKSKSKRKRIFQ